MSTPPVGDCPKNPEGHVWASSRVSTSRPCEFCGLPGRGEGGFLDTASAARSELFSKLRSPIQQRDHLKDKA